MDLLGKISANALKIHTEAPDTLKLVELQLFQYKVCGTKYEGSKKRWVIQQDKKWHIIKWNKHVESLVFGTQINNLKC